MENIVTDRRFGMYFRRTGDPGADLQKPVALIS